MLSLNDYISGGQTTVSNLMLQNYHRLGLTTEEFMLWLQLFSANQAGNEFPNLIKIAQQMGLETEEIYQLLNQLMEKKFVEIETIRDAEGKTADRYNLLIAFEKLSDLQAQQVATTEKNQELAAQKKMFTTFEQELGRSLSPIEYQKIGYWLSEDSYTPELITLALQEAVLNQAYNFKYIEAVLQNWEKKNIHTPQQVSDEQKRRKQILLQKEEIQSQEQLPKVSLHNWLKEENSDAK